MTIWSDVMMHQSFSIRAKEDLKKETDPFRKKVQIVTQQIYIFFHFNDLILKYLPPTQL